MNKINYILIGIIIGITFYPKRVKIIKEKTDYSEYYVRAEALIEYFTDNSDKNDWDSTKVYGEYILSKERLNKSKMNSK